MCTSAHSGMNCLEERSYVQLKQNKKWDTHKINCKREVAGGKPLYLRKKLDSEGSPSQPFIDLLGESNYNNWCGINICPISILAANSWWWGSNNMAKVQKLGCDCLKDILKAQVLWSWIFAQLWTLAHRPESWSWTFVHSWTIAHRVWPHSPAPAVFDLKIQCCYCYR